MVSHSESVNDDTLLLKLQEEDLSCKNLERIYAGLKQLSFIKNVGIDLEEIKNCTNDLFNWLLRLTKIKKISVFNIASENLILFYIMNYNEYVSLFLTKNDFINGNNTLIYRKFKIC